MVDAHRGYVLFHRQLHDPLEYPHCIVGVKFDVLSHIVDGQRLIIVFGNKAQHLANIKLRMARDAVFVCARGFIDQNRFPAREAKSLEHQANFINGELANLLVRTVQFLLPAAHFKRAKLLCGS